MASLASFRAAWSPRLLSVLRIISAFLLMGHGMPKLFSFPAAREAGEPPLLSLLGVAGMLEVYGGALLLIGLFTSPVAFLLSGFTAVAYFMVHAPRGFWPILNGGTLAALYSFVFIYLAAAGGGPWSVDALIRRRR
ncbi:MAG: DoxX family protein [Gammaproteobacteria bacterium]|nr:DoxX family protein [Gammaproteobacteria bacterium]